MPADEQVPTRHAVVRTDRPAGRAPTIRRTTRVVGRKISGFRADDPGRIRGEPVRPRGVIRRSGRGAAEAPGNF
jgi:hypothetical protein